MILKERIQLEIGPEAITGVRELALALGPFSVLTRKRLAPKALETLTVPLHPRLGLEAIEPSAQALAAGVTTVLKTLADGAAAKNEFDESSRFAQSAQSSQSTRSGVIAGLLGRFSGRARRRPPTVEATLANALNRFVLLEESPALRHEADWRAYAEDRLLQKYGTSSEPWALAFSPREGALGRLLVELRGHLRRDGKMAMPPRHRLVSALPTAVVAALEEATALAGLHLAAIRPALVGALDQHRAVLGRLSPSPVWLVLLAHAAGARSERGQMLQAIAIRFSGARPQHLAQKLLHAPEPASTAQSLLQWLKREQTGSEAAGRDERIGFALGEQFFEAQASDPAREGDRQRLQHDLANWLGRADVSRAH